MCTPDLEYIFDPKPSTQTEIGCSNSILVAAKEEKIEEVDIQTEDGWGDDADVAGTSVTTDEAEEADEADEAEEDETEEDEDETDDTDETYEAEAEADEANSNCLIVTTENRESIQFVSFISNGERKVRIQLDGPITLSLENLRDHIDEIDLSLDRLVANDKQPVISDTALFTFLFFIYIATFAYFYLIYINMPIV